ncbi:peroxidasin [Plodia interpunctella]|uniref:peroxidasin n=1 Tax=Plodia interpunctella TaxID=58824 RepID=UPI0023678E90|nr:peroxidasin [Plodia interpunctella]
MQAPPRPIMKSTNFIKFFLLLILFTFALSDFICPSKCQCNRNTVRCLQQDLVAIPKAPPETHTLDLRFNKLYDIAPGVLSRLHRLRSLLLNDNKLKELRSGSFHGLVRLKYLYLYRNKIRHLDHDVFQGLERLEQLYLHVNEILQIEPDTFSNLPRLERLYLHNNLLKGLPRGSFRGMPKLRKLRLDSNALVCDCSMLWFIEMISHHSDMEVAATCYGPATATGISLASMTGHDMQCRHPEIEKGPEDVIVNFGEDAMFSCVATGEPKPEIMWLRDSAALPLDANRYEVMHNGTLMVHSANMEDIGDFECMAKNPAGEARSRPARMIIHANTPIDDSTPVFAVLPQKQVARINEPYIIFNCLANGNPKPHVAWFLNDERLLLNERYSIKPNGSLVILNVQVVDAGSYTCEAENINGKIGASADLEVMSTPAFLTVPTDQTVTSGTKAIFRCRARGVPKPTLSWFLNTMTLPENGNYVLSNENQVLTIQEATTDDEGIYHCRAENTEGLIEISAILKVNDIEQSAPRIVTKPENTDAFKGTSIQLPCESEGEPPASIEWRKDGTRIIQDNRIAFSLIGSLIINNVSVSDTGRYECSAVNDYGRDTASVFLTIKDHILPGDQYVNIALIQATRDVDQAISRSVEQLFNNTDGKNIELRHLYAISNYPNSPAREVARAAEIYERTLHKVKTFVQAGLKVSSTEPFSYESILSNEHLEVIARLSGCVAHREIKECSDMCFHNKYRSYDGSCNNFAHPMWGASLTGFRRILFPIYENGFSQPIGWNKGLKYNGYELPSARLVSITIITTKEISEDLEITHMTMQWGQWLDHDLDHALPSVSSETWDGVDCKKTCEYAAPCFPIDVPSGDPRISNRRCIDFIRTSAVCGSGVTSSLFGRLQPREQINQLTAFIDASQVYGFEKTVAEDLRDLTNENGLLRVGATFPGKKPLLPTTGINGMDCRRNLEESTRACFVAGDIRANEQIGLAAMHTIFMREHNRLASQLKSLNPFWDGDRVYQEARKIVGAEIQLITYEDWLPLVIGPEGRKQLGDYKGYNANLNPSISNVFATAALRFGHTMINPVLHRYDENFETIPQGHLLLRHAFFSPWRLVDEGGTDPLLRGMFITPAKLKTPTQNLNSELTEKLFYNAHAVALDLAAINIQRGRDHGIPPYTKWRQFCNMTEVNSFDDLKNEISDKDVRDKLQNLYGTVDNIDVWVGGVLEDQVEGGKVGPLFRCILIEQFRRLRDGDRFWYENPTMFKHEQLEQIKQTSLARILCDNGDNIDTIGENVFILPDAQDGMISCDDLSSIELRYWVDCESCGDDRTEPTARRARRNVADTLEDNRLNQIVDSQTDLMKTVEMLKERLESLEQTCLG